MAKLNVILRDSGGNSKAGYRVAVYDGNDDLVADTNDDTMIDNGDGSYISAEDMDAGEYTVKYATTPSGVLAVVPGYEAFSFGATITGTVAIANGGTGATDVSTARTNLGLEIDADVQAHSASLDEIDAIEAPAPGSFKFPVISVDGWAGEDASSVRGFLGVGIGTDVQQWDSSLDDLVAIASNPTNSPGFLTFQNGLCAEEDAAGMRTQLGLGTVATESTVPINKGGTGAATAELAREELGLKIDRDVQRWYESLDDFAAAFESPADSPSFLASEMGGIEAKSTAQMRTLLGIGNAGLEDVVPIVYGGTGATTASNARAASRPASPIPSNVLISAVVFASIPPFSDARNAGLSAGRSNAAAKASNDADHL